MTTIAYKAGMLACDSCWSYGNAQIISATKITRLRSGALAGFAGDNDDRALRALLEDATPSTMPSYGDLVALKQDGAALIVFPNDRDWTGAPRVFMVYHAPNDDKDNDDLGVWEVQPADMAAIGSGKVAALGAMKAGVGAKRAVEIACELDMYSRPPIHILTAAVTF